MIRVITEPKNAIADLKVEVLAGDGWEIFELNDQSPGFLMFVYTIFNCQHMYMRVNCAERGLVLDSATGTVNVVTDEDWVIQTLHVQFDARLESGTPDADDVDYIMERMEHCPVSGNLNAIPDSLTELHLG